MELDRPSSIGQQREPRSVTRVRPLLTLSLTSQVDCIRFLVLFTVASRSIRTAAELQFRRLSDPQGISMLALTPLLSTECQRCLSLTSDCKEMTHALLWGALKPAEYPHELTRHQAHARRREGRKACVCDARNICLHQETDHLLTSLCPLSMAMRLSLLFFQVR